MDLIETAALYRSLTDEQRKQVADCVSRIGAEHAGRVLRCLVATRFKLSEFERVYERVAGYEREMIERPIDEAYVACELATGKSYVFGRDREGHPIIHIRSKHHLRAGRDMDRMMAFVTFVMERAVELCRRSGALQVTLIMCREGTTRANSDLPFATHLITLFSQRYPERLAHMFAFPMNVLMRAGWAVCRPFMDARTVSKMHLFKSVSAAIPVLHQFIDPSNLEVRSSDCALQRAHRPATVQPDLGGTADFRYSYPPVHDQLAIELAAAAAADVATADTSVADARVSSAASPLPASASVPV